MPSTTRPISGPWMGLSKGKTGLGRNLPDLGNPLPDSGVIGP